jgi:S-DNA-T family DNA segregation ATPase FtsK/SpoIIIE
LSDLIVYKGFDFVLSCLSIIFLDRNIFDTCISANRLKIWFWDLFAIIVLSVLFGFFTSVPELGGTVGYE